MFRSPFYPLQVVSSAASRILSAVTSGGSCFRVFLLLFRSFLLLFRGFLLLFCFVLCWPELCCDLPFYYSLQSLFKFFCVESNGHNRSRFLRRRSSFFPVIVSLINRCGTSQFTAFISVSYCAACFTSAKNSENFTSVLSSFSEHVS